MLSDERIRQIAEDIYCSEGTRAEIEYSIRVALTEAAQSVPVVGEAVALREFADEVKQLCKDFSDRHNRPYMGDVTAAIDGLLAQFVASQTSHVTQAELERLRKDAARFQAVVIISQAALCLPSTRTDEANRMLSAYQAAVNAGLGIEPAIDAAMQERQS